MSVVKFSNDEQRVELAVQNTLMQYVNKQIDLLKREHEEEVKDTYYLGKEYTVEEYEQIIDELQQKTRNIPEFESNEYISASDLKQEYLRNCAREINYVKEDLSKCLKFKQYIEERKQQLMKTPRNEEMIVNNLIEYIKKQVKYYHQDILTEYYDMFVAKVNALIPNDKDYERTIKSVYTNKNGKKAMQLLNSFSDRLISVLSNIAFGFRNVEIKGSLKGFKDVERLIKNKITSVINGIYDCVYNFIKSEIDCIPNEQLTCSAFVKTYTESLMGSMNNAIVNRLPAVLDEEFNQRIQNLKEDLRENPALKVMIKSHEDVEMKAIAKDGPIVEEVEEVEEPTLVIPNEKPTLEKFIESLPNTPIEISELTTMYNQYFGVNISNNSLSKIKDFRNHFDVSRKCVNKSKKTFYTKK